MYHFRHSILDAVGLVDGPLEGAQPTTLLVGVPVVPDGGLGVDGVEPMLLVEGGNPADAVVLLEAGYLGLERNEMILLVISAESFSYLGLEEFPVAVLVQRVLDLGLPVLLADAEHLVRSHQNEVSEFLWEDEESLAPPDYFPLASTKWSDN